MKATNNFFVALNFFKKLKLILQLREGYLARRQCIRRLFTHIKRFLKFVSHSLLLQMFPSGRGSCVLYAQADSVNPAVNGAVALTFDQGCNFDQKFTLVRQAGSCASQVLELLGSFDI